MFRHLLAVVLCGSLTAILLAAESAPIKINPAPKPLASDPSVKLDYDIVYVRAPRVQKGAGRDIPTAWPEFGHPTHIDAGYDLMLLKPDGKEEVLVSADKGSVTDPFVSLDGESVYYVYHHNPKAGEWTAGADIYKIHVKTRKITRLTQQHHTPNTGVADWARDYRTPEKGKTSLPYGVYNLGPCPLPGGKIVFSSNRDGVKTPRGYPQYALQLHVMDADGSNVEKIGHLNVAGALHPVVLTDGRIIFSTLESQGVRGTIDWGVWSIHPDGTNWEPVISAFHSANGFHFQSQLSDGSIVIENYYNQNNRGFGTHVKLPLRAPKGMPAFGPGYQGGPVDPKMRMLFSNRWGEHHLPFKPQGMEIITRFATWEDRAASLSDPKDPKSPRVGKVTHPSGAPNNHLLTVWTPGATPNANGPVREDIHAGIYLIKDGTPIDEPAQMLRIKHDPDYNTHWPRALVPYKRIYGMGEPKLLPTLVNNGKQSPHLPEGTPFGLVGTSSLYKRESYPGGVVPKGSVTATYREKDSGHLLAAFSEVNAYGNWRTQGSDTGLYDNSQIHAIRILAMEPATSPVANKFYNIAHERLRILGEIPVRKFQGEEQPRDPDGNPDTSFLAKIPADVAFTFQTLDKDGMVLNMAQTWHQLRPGEVRNNCGGCHAHSQKPTLFEDTAASKADYPVWDLTAKSPLLTAKAQDESGKKWDSKDSTGVRFAPGVTNVEYWRDVRPILDRSCVACHTKKSKEPAGELVLDADDETVPGNFQNHGFRGQPPGTYFRLAMDNGVRSQSHHQPLFGKKPEHHWRSPLASRYVANFQSRRSLLIWQVFGRRTDGLPESLPWNNKFLKEQLMTDFKPTLMPPPEAVKSGKVKPLSDEDRRTLVRWIDLGCPIDLDYNPKEPNQRGSGWMLDDQRPTLTLTAPQAGSNPELTRILVGMHDYSTGIDLASFTVTADFPIDGAKPGENLAGRFKEKSEGVREWKLGTPVKDLKRGTLTVAVKDRQGNITRIERTISVK